MMTEAPGQNAGSRSRRSHDENRSVRFILHAGLWAMAVHHSGVLDSYITLPLLGNCAEGVAVWMDCTKL